MTDARNDGERPEAATGKATDAARQATEQVRAGAERAGEAIRVSGQRMAEKSSAIGVTIIDQVETNASEAFSALRAAAKARDLSEVMTIQGEFLRAQGQRSMTQAREIGELIMQFGRDAVAPLRDAARSQTDESTEK